MFKTAITNKEIAGKPGSIMMNFLSASLRKQASTLFARWIAHLMFNLVIIWNVNNWMGAPLTQMAYQMLMVHLLPLQRRRKGKRPASRSSAAEMLNFLKEYSEKGEKTEEEKLTLLREMKEEKQQFYDHFFDLMKKE